MRTLCLALFGFVCFALFVQVPQAYAGELCSQRLDGADDAAQVIPRDSAEYLEPIALIYTPPGRRGSRRVDGVLDEMVRAFYQVQREFVREFERTFRSKEIFIMTQGPPLASVPEAQSLYIVMTLEGTYLSSRVSWPVSPERETLLRKNGSFDVTFSPLQSAAIAERGGDSAQGFQIGPSIKVPVQGVVTMLEIKACGASRHSGVLSLGPAHESAFSGQVPLVRELEGIRDAIRARLDFLYLNRSSSSQ